MENISKDVADLGVDNDIVDLENDFEASLPQSSEVRGVEPSNGGSKRGRKQSIVWDHFTKPDPIPTKGARTTCKHCLKSYAYDPSNIGTSTLKKHLENMCKNSPLRVDKRQKTLNFQPIGEGGNLVSHRFTKELGRSSLVKMIVMDELSFKFVKNEGFRYFMSIVRPEFELPGRRTIAREMLSLFVEKKKKLIDFFRNSSHQFCFTTGAWTSCQNINYLVLTVHYIDDDWNLQKRILNFEVISNHRGETIGKMIETCLLAWGIDRVFTITVDNASSNDTAVSFLKKKVQNFGKSVLNCEYMHMRCCAHILNLVVTDGLKEYNSSIQVIRNVVKYVRGLPARTEKFKECARIEKLDDSGIVCLDVPTRWNSTFLMLEAALKYRKAFERMGEDGQYTRYFNVGPSELFNEENVSKHYDVNRIGPPNDVDWEVVSCFKNFLEVFFEVTNRFSGSLYVTSSSYFHDLCLLDAHISDCINNGNWNLSVMASKMKEKFDKYWGDVEKMNPLLYVAVVLDPRYRKDYVDWSFEDMYPDGNVANRMKAKVSDSLTKLYDYYNVGSSSSQRDMKMDGNSTTMDSLLSLQERRMLKYKSRLEDGNGERSELEKYLTDGKESMDGSFDLLAWWKRNSSKYKVLSRLARDVLAVPVSTVASESAFSTGGRILDPFRSSLSPKTVQALICTQDWLRCEFKREQKKTDYREVLKDIEELEGIEKDFATHVNICTDHIE